MFWDEAVDDWWPSYGRPGEIGEGISHYPTDFTRDVTPIPCHSHNDYWRKRPLYDALHYGCTGVEADVWTFPSDPALYVGHSASALTKNRTFTAMYVDPIADILDAMNNRTAFPSSRTTPRGVFDEDPDQALVLLVDFKNGDKDIFEMVFAQTQRLRDADYLTHWDGHKVVERPVTIVGTGNTPFDMIVSNTTYRSIFFDAPLSQLALSSADADAGATQHGQGTIGVSADSKFDASNSYYASINFRAAFGSRFWHRFSDKQLRTLRAQVAGAKRAGLKARYWGAPGWPIAERNAIWKLLWEEDVGVLNADDLLSVSKMDWRTRVERLEAEM
ncbi:MAG: hypothetical protein INR71_15325 [Terriglobus roseus]|nr:hypothetical protein [Terriglobus roseus]